MKLQPDRLDVQSILGYGPGWVGLGRNGVAEKIERSVIIGSRGELVDWDCARFEDLSAEHFDQLAGYRPELVIFGSGSRLRFPPPAFLRSYCQITIKKLPMFTADPAIMIAISTIPSDFIMRIFS